MRRRDLVGGLALATLTLTACSSAPGAVLQPPWTQTRGATITVTVEKGCPSSLGDAGNVDFSKLSQPGHLAPADRAPDAAVVCEYGWPAPGLKHQIVLTATDAKRLAAAAASVAIKAPPSGPTSCPADDGSTTVIAFSYPSSSESSGGVVDLWYHPKGCQWIANGDVATSQMGNLSFDNFQSVLLSMEPAPWGQ
jgi:hypothetical protein